MTHLLRSAARGDTVLHMESDRTELLFQPRTVQAWFIMPLDPMLSADAAKSYVVRDHLRNHPEGGARRRTSGPQGQCELVVRKEAKGWVCATVAGDDVGPATVPLSEDGPHRCLVSFRSGLPLTDD